MEGKVLLDSVGETSFGKGLRVLLALIGGVPRSAADIAQEVQLPLSSSYRYLRELRRYRLVDEVGSGTYAAGTALLTLALGTPFREQMRLHAEPALRALAARTGETVLLSVRVDLRALIVAQVESAERVRLSFTTGSCHPLHAGATATVLLAFEPPSIVDQVLARPLARFTEQTARDADDLRRRLADIRVRGYAVSTGEVDAHATAIAVPVFNRGMLLCALSVTGPTVRFSKNQVDSYAAILLEEASRLGRLFASTQEASISRATSGRPVTAGVESEEPQRAVSSPSLAGPGSLTSASGR